MAELTETSFQAGTVEHLYGPLNDVERKNAPPRLWLQGDSELLRQGQRVAVEAFEIEGDGGRLEGVAGIAKAAPSIHDFLVR